MPSLLSTMQRSFWNPIDPVSAISSLFIRSYADDTDVPADENAVIATSVMDHIPSELVPPLFAGTKRSRVRSEEQLSVESEGLVGHMDLFLGPHGDVRVHKTEQRLGKGRKRVKTANEYHRDHPHKKRDQLGEPGRIDIMVRHFSLDAIESSWLIG